MADKSKRNPQRIINMLTILTGVLIVYSVFITIIFVYTSRELEEMELHRQMDTVIDEISTKSLIRSRYEHADTKYKI